MHKDARVYAMRWLAALVVGCAAALGGCGGDAERAAQVQPTATAAVVSAAVMVGTDVPPTATPVAPTAIPPTPTFASAAPEWLPTTLPDTPTPTATPDPSTAAPSTATPSPDDSTRLAVPRSYHTAELLPDGRVILGGGWSGVANNNFIAPLPLTHFDVYLPAEGWSVISPADDDQAIFDPSIVLMADGTILLVGIRGDETGDDFTNAAAILDPATQLWTPLPAPVIAQSSSRFALLQDGRVLAAGGEQVENDGAFTIIRTFLTETEIFDPRTGQWQPAANTNHASQYSTIVALQNGGALLVHNAYTADDEIGAEIYDPDADEWRVVPGMRGARGVPKAAVLSDGRVLAIGATIDTTGEGEYLVQTVKGSAEIYDPATGAWTPTGDMVGARVYFSALTSLPDGRALASGGMGQGDGAELQMFTTEIYDPDTNAWTPGPNLLEPRYGHSATALPDGSVLIAGGVTILLDIWEVYPTDTSEIITVP